MTTATNRPTLPRAHARSAGWLAVPGVLSFSVPLVGFLTSLLLPAFAARVRNRLWPTTSPAVGHLCAALVVTGLWLPAVLTVVSAGRLGLDATTWLVLPLCTPAGASLFMPAAVALAAYLGGLGVAVLVRSPWPWVVGAWGAPLAYSAAGRWLVDFACVA